jgi:hypothetical protein
VAAGALKRAQLIRTAPDELLRRDEQLATVAERAALRGSGQVADECFVIWTSSDRTSASPTWRSCRPHSWYAKGHGRVNRCRQVS